MKLLHSSLHLVAQPVGFSLDCEWVWVAQSIDYDGAWTVMADFASVAPLTLLLTPVGQVIGKPHGHLL